jgi:hypothetical protein
MLMCIENDVPFMNLFATHPPIEARLRAISDITNTPIPVLSPPGPALQNDRFGQPAGDKTSLWNTGRRRNPWA